MLLQGLSSNYHLLYGALLARASSSPRRSLAAPRTVVRRAPWLAGSAPGRGRALRARWPLPYLDASREHGYARDLPAGIDLEHYVSTRPPTSSMARGGPKCASSSAGRTSSASLSLALAAAALGLWAAGGAPIRGPRSCPRGSGSPPRRCLALLFVALSLGRDLVVFGHDLGPGPVSAAASLRARLPAGADPGAPVAARDAVRGAARGARAHARRRTAAAGWRWRSRPLVPLEHLGTLPVSERVPVAHRVPEVYRWIAAHPTGAMAEVPVHGEGLVREETLEMYFSAYHFKPIIHGYTAYPPLLTRHLRRLAAEFPSPASLHALQRVGVDTVVVHHGRPLGADLARRLRDTAQIERAPRRSCGSPSRTCTTACRRRWRRGASAWRRAFEGPPARLFRSTARRGLPDRRRRTPMPVAPFPAGHAVRDPALGLPRQGRRSRARVRRRHAHGVGRAAGAAGRRVPGGDVPAAAARVGGGDAPAARQRVPDALPRRGTRGRPLDGAGALRRRRTRCSSSTACSTIPASAAIGFDLGPAGRELGGISLLVEDGGDELRGLVDSGAGGLGALKDCRRRPRAARVPAHQPRALDRVGQPGPAVRDLDRHSAWRPGSRRYQETWPGDHGLRRAPAAGIHAPEADDALQHAEAEVGAAPGVDADQQPSPGARRRVEREGHPRAGRRGARGEAPAGRRWSPTAPAAGGASRRGSGRSRRCRPGTRGTCDRSGRRGGGSPAASGAARSRRRPPPRSSPACCGRAATCSGSRIVCPAPARGDPLADPLAALAPVDVGVGDHPVGQALGPDGGLVKARGLPK